ncbi:MAG: ABC transporter permease [Oscillospiraceae bacterium]|jgi:ABC-2 type transport system permease protein
MRNTGIVFSFEYVQQVKKKSFIVSTVIIGIILAVMMTLPAVLGNIIGGSSDVSTGIIEGGVYYEDSSLQGILPFEAEYDSEEALDEAVRNGDVSVGYVIVDSLHLKVVYNNYGINSSSQAQSVSEALRQIYVEQSLADMGVSAEYYQEIASAQVQEETEILGTNTANRYITGMIYVIILYMLIIMYGQMVSVAVAREKDSKAMEILITTSDAKSLIMGKVLGTICAALTAFAFFMVCALVPYALLKDKYSMAVSMMLSQALSADIIFVYVAFFIISLFMYMFIYAALGSLVSKVEDINSAVTPVTMIIIVSYILAFVSLNGIDSTLMRVCSWIPPVSVLLIPMRYSNATISFPMTLLVMAVDILFVVFLAWLSVRIYRLGVLNYGDRIKFGAAIKKAFSKKSTGTQAE